MMRIPFGTSLLLSVFFLGQPCFAAGLAPVRTAGSMNAPPDDSASALVSRLQSGPQAQDIKQGVRLLSAHEGADEEASLLQVLHDLLLRADSQEQVLNALAAFRVPDFEPEIIRLLPPNADNLTTDNPLLAAIRTSGGTGSMLALVDIAFRANQPGNASKGQAVVLRIVVQRTPVLAIRQMLRHSESAGGTQLTPDSVTVLVDAIQQGNPETTLALHQDYLEFTLGKLADPLLELHSAVPFEPVIECGVKDSTRYRILVAIEQAEIKEGSAASLSALLVFADADAKEISDVAIHADYGPLKRNGWLVPRGAFNFTIAKGLVDKNNKFHPLPKTSAVLSGLQLDTPDIPFVDALAQNSYAHSDETHKQLKQVEELDATVQFMESQLKRLNLSLGLKLGEANPNLHHALQDLAVQYDTLWGSGTGVSPDRAESVLALFIRHEIGPQNDKNPSSAANLQAESTGRYLAHKEAQHQALLAFAITSALRAHSGLEGKLDFSDLSAQLSRLLSALGSSIPVSTAVGSLDSIDQNQKNILQSLSTCHEVAFKVVSRAFSLDQGVFEEKLVVSCDAAKNYSISWVGTIPLDLLFSLRQQSRIFDPTGISLAEREIRREVDINENSGDDISLVVANPGPAFFLLASAAKLPAVPWAEVSKTLKCLVAAHIEDLRAVTPTDQENRNAISFKSAVVSSILRSAKGALTAKQLAEVLNISPKTVFKLAKAGRIPSFRVGTAVRSTVFKLAKAGRIPSFRVGTAVRFDARLIVDWLRRQRTGHPT
jgi:excisionase family DNA binding protein